MSRKAQLKYNYKIYILISILFIIVLIPSSITQKGQYENNNNIYYTNLAKQVIYAHNDDWYYLSMENDNIGFNKNTGVIGFAKNNEFIGEIIPIAVAQYNNNYYLCPLINPENVEKSVQGDKYEKSLIYSGNKEFNCYQYDNYENSVSTNIDINEMKITCSNEAKCKINSDITFTDFIPSDTGFGYVIIPKDLTNVSKFRYVNYNNKVIDLNKIEKKTITNFQFEFLDVNNNSILSKFNWEDMMHPETKVNNSIIKFHFEVLEIANKRGLLVGTYGYGNITNIKIDPTYSISNISLDAKLENVVCEGGGKFCHLEINDTSLVAYYPFDIVNDSTTVYDWSGNYDGTLNSDGTNATWVSSGRFGGAYNFTDVGNNIDNNYIQIGTDDDFWNLCNTTTGCTVSAWIYHHGVGGGTGVAGTIIARWDYLRYFFMLQAGQWGSISFYISENGNATWCIDAQTHSYNVWEHVVGVYNKSHVMTYVNGVNTAPVACPFSQINETAWKLSENTMIGLEDDSQFMRHLNGSIDEVMIFNRSLSAGEVSDIYNAQYGRFYSPANHTIKPTKIDDGYDRVNVTVQHANQNSTNLSLRIGYMNASIDNLTDLVAYYPFEWGKAWDISGADNDGTVTGATYNESGGLNNTGGFEFDGAGSGNKITIGTGTDFWDLANSTTGFTISAWVYKIDGTTSDYVVTKLDTNGNNRFFYLMIDSSEETNFLIYKDGQSVGTCLAVSNVDNAPLNTWIHLIGVYNKTDTLVYRDGIIKDTTACTFSINQTAWQDEEDTLIGWANGVGSGGVFNGTIDEVMIFNRSLSASEITELYNNQVKNYQKVEHSSYANMTDNTIETFTISNESRFIFPDIIYIADTNKFWSPILEENITMETYSSLDLIPPAINFTAPTPADGQTIDYDHIYVNVSASDAGEMSVFLDWNRSLRGWWNMDNRNGTGTGNVVYDNSTYLMNGTITGASHTADGKRGGAFVFGEINASYRINVASFSSSASGLFTISFWLKQSAANVGGWPMALYNGSQYIFYFTDLIGSRMYFYTYNTSGTGSVVDTGYNSIADTEWHHIVAGINYSIEGSRESFIYLDGVLISSAIAGGAQAVGTGTMHIGNNPNYNVAFNGTLDEVMIFDRALSATEIKALYDATSGRGLETNFTNLDDSDYQFQAFAIDASGNINHTEVRTVTVTTVDTTPPVITFQDPTDVNTSVTTRNWSYFNVSSDEAVDNCSLTLNGTLHYMNELTTTIFYINITDLTGNFTYNATCNDTSGNWGNTSTNWVNLSYFPAVADTTSPMSNISINDTSPEINEWVNVSLNVSDEIGLSHCWFYNNLSMTNSSLIALSGTSDTSRCHNLTQINVTSGNDVHFIGYVNDTSNNLNYTEITITVIDTVKPMSNISINDTTPRINEWVNVSLNVSDTDTLSHCWFWNNMSFTNSSLISLSGNSDNDICNNVSTINVTQGNSVLFRGYVNDTSNNLNFSEIIITVGNTAPATPTIIFPLNYINYSFTNISLNVSSSDDDLDTITYYFFINKSLNKTSTNNHSFVGYDSDFNFTVMATDGTVFTLNTSVIFGIDTTSPTITITFNNTSPKYNEDINASATADETITKWFVWNNITFINTTGYSYNVSKMNLTVGNNISYVFCANDTVGNMGCNYDSVVIANTIPVITAPIINSTPNNENKTNSTLWCYNTSQSDADGQELVISYRWFNNSVLMSFTDQYVHHGNTTKNDNWACEINASDGIAQIRSNSTNLTILNSPPYLNATIPNLVADSDSVLNISGVNVTDVDGDILNYHTNNSIISVIAGVINDSVIPQTDAGTYSINISIDDGTDNTSQIITYTITDVTMPLIVQYPMNETTTNETLEINVTFDENSNLSVLYALLSAPTVMLGNFTNATYSTLHRWNFSGLINGTSYWFNYSWCDSSANCNSSNVTFTTAQNPPIIDTTPPTITATINYTAPKINWDVNISATADETITTWYFWDNLSFTNTSTLANFNITTINVSGGNNISFIVCGNDASGNTGCDLELSIVVNNTEPIYSVIINSTPSNENKTNSTLWCYNTSQSEVDGEEITISYRWYNNSALMDFVDQSVNFKNTTKNDNWVCEINASDGIYQVRTNSTNLTILNSPPYINVTILDFSADTGSVLNVSTVNVTDIDGDTITYYTNNSIISIIDGIINDSVIPVTDAGIYDINITVSDSEANDSQVVTYTINDITKPMSNISINDTSVQINEDVNISMNVSDEIGLSYCWFFNNLSMTNSTLISISGKSNECSNITYINVTVGNSVLFRGYVNDTFGNLNYSDITITIVDTKPPASNITINNTSPDLNEWVNVSMNVSDENGLSHCWFWNNMSRTNSSLIALSGTSDTNICNNVTKLSVSGDILWRGYVNDTSNNLNYSQILTSTAIADTTSPNVTLLTTFKNQFLQDLIYTATDNIAIDTCFYSLLTQSGVVAISNTTIAGCANTTFSTGSYGSFILYIYANDSAGNIGYDSANFTVTDISPGTSGGGGGPTTSPSEFTYTVGYICDKVELFREDHTSFDGELVYDSYDLDSLKNQIRSEKGFTMIDTVLEDYIKNYALICIENDTKKGPSKKWLINWTGNITLPTEINLSFTKLLSFANYIPFTFFDFKIGQRAKPEDVDKWDFYDFLNMAFHLRYSDEITDNPDIILDGVRSWFLLILLIGGGLLIFFKISPSKAKDVRKRIRKEIDKLEKRLSRLEKK